MAQYIDKDTLVVEIKRKKKSAGPAHFCEETYEDGYYRGLNEALFTINSIEVKEEDFCTISENLMEAYEYLDFTHTSNLAHNKPMVAARLKKAIQELYNAGLLKLTHDEKYRIESLGLKTQKGE